MLSVVFIAVYPMDTIILSRAEWRTLVLRCVWAVTHALYGLCVHRVSARWHRPWSMLSSLADTLFFLGLIHLTGAAGSPYFPLLFSAPLLLSQVYPTHLVSNLLGGAVAGVGALLMLLDAGRSWVDALFWCFLCVGSAALGLYVARQSRRVIAAEERASAEQARREAIERIAMTEYARARAEKLATLGRLAANVLHELNNPLAFVRANLQFLRQELRALPQQDIQPLQEALEETATGVERIQQIAADLRGFSRMDEEGPARCSLADVVPSTLRIASLRLKHVEKVWVELPENLPEVNASPQRLAQVLLNLLVNAGDALAARKEGAEVRLTARHEQGHVTLLVEDNGPGIPPDVLPRLFEPFFTTKGPELGTGLGLALSRELIEKFNGSLSAENRPEGGARMRLVLQVCAPAPTTLSA
ncbi:MAG TPA: ATP-binding protein [Myxococcaceae bacterium]